MSVQSVSLVLGSGGARGLAQIGVIRWLEEHASDYTVTSIAGSSMGAVIGGIHAAGELDAYERWVRGLRRQDVWRLLDFSFSGAGLFRGDRVIEQLREMLGDRAIEELPITFTAVATDIERKREVWLNSGSLFDAIRASIAIPSVFTPVEHGGRLLVDGGLLNPVPMGPTMVDPSDITIAVSLSGRMAAPEKMREPDEPSTWLSNGRRLAGELVDALPDSVGSWLEGLHERLGRGGIEPRLSRAQEARALNFIDIISQSIEAMQGSIARHRMAAYSPDHLIEVPVDACGMLDFHRADEMIDLGYRLAAERFPTRPG
ncbi:MAG: patatin-like phospholipase family protein [Thiohalospira sp.]